MIIKTYGNFFTFSLEQSEAGKPGTLNYTFPDGYSYTMIMVNTSNNNFVVKAPNSGKTLTNNTLYIFPVVNSKSPNTITLSWNTSSVVNDGLNIYIFKFGGIPDSHYFDKAFDPILITTNDENNHAVEYNMIPSTQFER